MARGAGPRDGELFTDQHLVAMSTAAFDLGILFERGYAEAAALKLVGDHYQLHQRQRLAVLRCAASPSEISQRKPNHVSDLKGEYIDIDGFNLVILLEAAIGGGMIFDCADGTFRDLSSIHGTYRMVEQTRDVIEWAGKWFEQQGLAGACWWLDAPVSNSGRLAAAIRDLCEVHGWKWQVEVTPYVDKELSKSPNIVVSTDKIILNKCQRWVNLGRMLIEDAASQGQLTDIWIIELPRKTEREALMQCGLIAAQLTK